MTDLDLWVCKDKKNCSLVKINYRYIYCCKTMETEKMTNGKLRFYGLTPLFIVLNAHLFA